jgi:hypothetical protein
VNTQYHANASTHVPSRSRTTARCHRHHNVWMAACTDCRDAHAPLVESKRRKADAAR